MTHIHVKRDMRKTFIDLYAGAGGFSLGLIEAGMKCIAAVEYMPDAVLSYWYNLCMYGWSSLITDPEEVKKNSRYRTALERLKKSPHTNNQIFDVPDDYWTSHNGPSPALSVWMYDILRLDPQMIMDKYDFKPGELGAIVGGPPCQGFSNSGRREFDDPRNQHPFRYMHFCEVMQPGYFLLENVPGLITLGKKKGEKEGPFPQWIKEAGEKAGYHVEYHIHNAKDYGVPQTRRRVIFSGVRKDLYAKGKRYEMAPPTHTYDYFDYYGPDPKKAQYIKGPMGMYKHVPDPPPGEPYVDVYEAIGDLNAIRLSSSKDEDLIKDNVPFGDMNRIGRGKNNDDPKQLADYVRYGDHYYYRDRFNGVFFARNHVNYHPWNDDEMGRARSMHYHRCPECNKFNKIVRPKCWSCKAPLQVLNPR